MPSESKTCNVTTANDTAILSMNVGNPEEELLHSRQPTTTRTAKEDTKEDNKKARANSTNFKPILKPSSFRWKR